MRNARKRSSRISQAEGLRRISRAFNQQGWKNGDEIARQIIHQMSSDRNPPQLESAVQLIPRTFLVLNQVTRKSVWRVLDRTLQGVTILSDGDETKSTVYIAKGDINVDNSKRETNITNNGQFAGNVSSSNSEVNFDKQQQVVGAEHDQLLRTFMDKPQIQEVINLPIEPEEKTSLMGTRLAKLANVGVDVATTFAAKFLAESIKG